MEGETTTSTLDDAEEIERAQKTAMALLGRADFVQANANDSGYVSLEKLMADASLAEFAGRPSLVARALIASDAIVSTKGKSFKATEKRHIGVVKKYVHEKEFGFIGGEGIERDLFFHRRSVVNGVQLSVGDTVSYIIDYHPRRDEAREVTLMKNIALASSNAQYVPMDEDDYMEHRMQKMQQRNEGRLRYKMTAYSDTSPPSEEQQHECPYCHVMFHKKPLMEQHIVVKHPGATEYLQGLEAQKAGKGEAAPASATTDEVIRQLTLDVQGLTGTEGFSLWVDRLRMAEYEPQFTANNLKTIEDLRQITQAQEDSLMESLKLPLGHKKRLKRALAALREP